MRCPISSADTSLNSSSSQDASEIHSYLYTYGSSQIELRSNPRFDFCKEIFIKMPEKTKSAYLITRFFKTVFEGSKLALQSPLTLSFILQRFHDIHIYPSVQSIERLTSLCAMGEMKFSHFSDLSIIFKTMNDIYHTSRDTYFVFQSPISWIFVSSNMTHQHFEIKAPIRDFFRDWSELFRDMATICKMTVEALVDLFNLSQKVNKVALIIFFKKTQKWTDLLIDIWDTCRGIRYCKFAIWDFKHILVSHRDNDLEIAALRVHRFQLGCLGVFDAAKGILGILAVAAFFFSPCLEPLLLAYIGMPTFALEFFLSSASLCLGVGRYFFKAMMHYEMKEIASDGKSYDLLKYS
jgi:hypothetical protein